MTFYFLSPGWYRAATGHPGVDARCVHSLSQQSWNQQHSSQSWEREAHDQTLLLEFCHSYRCAGGGEKHLLGESRKGCHVPQIVQTKPQLLAGAVGSFDSEVITFIVKYQCSCRPSCALQAQVLQWGGERRKSTTWNRRCWRKIKDREIKYGVFFLKLSVFQLTYPATFMLFKKESLHNEASPAVMGESYLSCD